ETGVRERASYVLQQGKIRLVLTTPLRPDGEIAQHVHRHGDGVRDVALWVDDAARSWKETTKRGARSVAEPHELKDEHGTVSWLRLRRMETPFTRLWSGRAMTARFCRGSARSLRIRWRGLRGCSISTTWLAMWAGMR